MTQIEQLERTPVQTTAPWRLPPLILHPFSPEKGSDRLVEGSRAHLVLNGLLPETNQNHDELTRVMLAGRYQELRMLFYIGKDLQRWTEQCMDFVSREPQLTTMGIREQSFATLLVEHPPAGMAAKLGRWGVGGQRSIFSRAMGINTLFQQVPSLDVLSPMFVQSYQRFGDYLFIAYQTMQPFLALTPASFQFELYASEEYSRMISEGWR